MSVPLSDTRLTEIEFRFWRARDTGELSMSQTDVGVLLDEVKRLRAELADSCPADCPCRQIPLTTRWDNTVIHPKPADTEDTDTVVCCIADGGQPVAVMLDDDQREALGLALLLPDGDGDIDPQHLELQRENEQLRAELAELTKAPRERANDRVRALLAAGDHEGASAAAEAFEASEAYDAAHPRY